MEEVRETVGSGTFLIKGAAYRRKEKGTSWVFYSSIII